MSKTEFTIRSLLGLGGTQKDCSKKPSKGGDNPGGGGDPLKLETILQVVKGAILVYRVPLNVTDEEMRHFLMTNGLSLEYFHWQPILPRHQSKTAFAVYSSEEDANAAVTHLNYRWLNGGQVVVFKFCPE